jgi:hypothetical protein
MKVYVPLTTQAIPAIDTTVASDSASTVIRAGRSPARTDENLLGQTLAQLSPDRGNEVMSSILALANSLAVADRLALIDDSTAERSLAKAVRGIERGLIEVARAQSRPLARILDAVFPLDLFRIGATLDASLRLRNPRDDWTESEELDDWNIETEEIAEQDATPTNLNVRSETRDTD